MTEPTESSAPVPATSRGGGGLATAGLWLCRGLLALLFANAALNLAAGLGTAADPARVFDGLVHGAYADLLGELASPAAAFAAVRTWPPAALILFGAAWALLTAVVLWLRPGAAAGLLLAGFLLLLTLRSTGADLWSDLAAAKPLWLLLGVALYGVAILVTVVRWRLLLVVQGIVVPLWALARLTLIGVFFNLAIPGAVSGDLVKMGYITARAGERKAEAVLTILVDRIIGMLGMFIVATVSILCALPLLIGLEARYRPLQLAAATVALGSCGGVAGVLLVEFRTVLLRQPGIAWLVALGTRVVPVTLGALIVRWTTALELYRHSRLTVLKAVLLSVGVHGLLATALCALGKALGERALGLHHYVITTAVANAVASIPLTPGGVGTRDKVTAGFLSAFQADPASKAGSIPVLLSLVIVFWALVGAVVFVRTARRPPA
jgi:uncharacterized membrane protein YbhN (UPF0104 family)